jgi:hypothetical protein
MVLAYAAHPYPYSDDATWFQLRDMASPNWLLDHAQMHSTWDRHLQITGVACLLEENGRKSNRKPGLTLTYRRAEGVDTIRIGMGIGCFDAAAVGGGGVVDADAGVVGRGGMVMMLRLVGA